MELIAEEKKHSPYGSSSAKRWGHCPGSVSAIAKAMKRSQDMTAAWRGTAQHTLAEHLLKYFPKSVGPEVVSILVEGQKIELSPEEITTVDGYVKEVVECTYIAGYDTMVLLEETLSLFKKEKYGAFGTLDCAIMPVVAGKDKKGIIYDYKSGRVPFEFDKDGLDQAGYLAVALKTRYPELNEIEVRIYQPNSSDGQKIVSTTFDKKALKAVAKKLERAIIDSQKENPQFFSGSYCHYCPALHECPEYRRMVEETAQKEFGGVDIVSLATIPAPSSIEPSKVKNLLAMKKALEKYFEALEEFWTSEAIAGRCPEGMKLVKGRSGKREWRMSEQEVFEALQARGIGTEQIYETTFRTPPALEKVVGKGINISDLVQQKDGKPSLVPLEDPRPGLVKDELVV